MVITKSDCIKRYLYGAGVQTQHDFFTDVSEIKYCHSTERDGSNHALDSTWPFGAILENCHQFGIAVWTQPNNVVFLVRLGCRWVEIEKQKKSIMQVSSMMTSSNGNMFRVTGLLCGEFTGDRWIPPHKGQWRGALIFSLICVWNNSSVNNGDAGDLRRDRVQYDVIVMVAIVDAWTDYVLSF